LKSPEVRRGIRWAQGADERLLAWSKTNIQKSPKGLSVDPLTHLRVVPSYITIDDVGDGHTFETVWVERRNYLKNELPGGTAGKEIERKGPRIHDGSRMRPELCRLN